MGVWGGVLCLRLLGGLLGASQGDWWYTVGVDRSTALLILMLPTLVLLVFFVVAWLYGDDDE